MGKTFLGFAVGLVGFGAVVGLPVGLDGLTGGFGGGLDGLTIGF